MAAVNAAESSAPHKKVRENRTIYFHLTVWARYPLCSTRLSLRFLAVLTAAAIGTVFGQTNPLAQLIEAARRSPPDPSLKELITTTLSPKGGTAVWGQDYLFVTDAAVPASISIDNEAAMPMRPVPGSNLSMLLNKMRTGVTHSYQYFSNGAPSGPAPTYGLQPRFLSAARRPKRNAE